MSDEPTTHAIAVIVRSRAPGRVNVIGDHTDYTRGLAMPMAIDLATTVEVRRGGDVVTLRSAQEAGVAVVPITVDGDEIRGTEPGWARYVAGVVAEIGPESGARGTVTTTLPVGAGLSSSAALEVAVALALGSEADPRTLALVCQRAENRASGVPCGVMDQLAITSGVAGCLMRIDCHSLEVTPVHLDDSLMVVGVHSGQARTLDGSEYGRRRAECEAAEVEIGPLRDAAVIDIEGLRDSTLRRRARHVVTENARVAAFADAIQGGHLHDAGRLMAASHVSLRDDFEVSTPVVDDLVERLQATPGVYGARMTGAGFGGVVVALCDATADVAAAFGGWRFRPSQGATVEVIED